jgi:3-dehydroquinate dehydratase
VTACDALANRNNFKSAAIAASRVFFAMGGTGAITRALGALMDRRNVIAADLLVSTAALLTFTRPWFPGQSKPGRRD